ncbi:hypothetical protein [Actomonas aquatica]|uniref:Sel1 repeat family protein n=1 Tax=Actomonas aquatica TaxID=2866162 RepID=A0ABZ1C763_9BACT|nr:hypothetical protein [Opitutus sp. WL0086]WRQ87098.1 hypothetical protein K1X11_019965 [Opitutus sp. WL0086]
MDIATFNGLDSPDGLDGALQALWWDAQGDWERAHTEAQRVGSPAGDWVHAYLHRKEGDIGNAGYWYARAGKPAQEAGVSLEREWEAIATELLAGD